ncbi:MAG: hypothetical protein JXQ73_24415 [Phycisphaerae bacterium]|nr:hypothetical protein [Phycisphaerae bacterium]
MSDSGLRQTQTLPTDHDRLQGELDRLEDAFAGLQKQLWHAQRLASLGTMAAMVAHEYNNIMTPIVSFAKYALEQDDSALLRSALEKCLKQAQQACRVSERVLNVATDQDRGPTSVNLAELVNEALECLGRDLAKDNIGLTIEVDPALKIRASAGEIQQVFVNLIQNARQAMLGRRGRLTIKAHRCDDQVRIQISDIGAGIRTEDLPRIFDPFFTTKSHADRPDKRGIGLGLAVCKDIITTNDGRIDVQSTLGHGTTFTIHLPAAD